MQFWQIAQPWTLMRAPWLVSCQWNNFINCKKKAQKACIWAYNCAMTVSLSRPSPLARVKSPCRFLASGPGPLSHGHSKSIASSWFETHLKMRLKNTLPLRTTARTPSVRRVPSHKLVLSSRPRRFRASEPGWLLAPGSRHHWHCSAGKGDKLTVTGPVLPQHCTSICVRFGCTRRASSVEFKPKKKQKLTSGKVAKLNKFNSAYHLAKIQMFCTG